MVLASDHITGATGLSPTVTLSKNGGSYASPSGAVTEIGNGYYKVAGSATDSATLGPLLLHASAATADPTDAEFEVIAPNVQSSTAFITGINSLSPPTNWNLLSVDGSGLVNISQTAADKVWGTTARVLTAGTNIVLPSNGLSGVTAWTVAITGNITGTVSGNATAAQGANLDAAITSRMATYTQPTGFLAANFTTGIPVSGTVTLASSQTFNNTGTWTGNLTGSVGSVTGLTASNLDATVSSRLATSGYTAPDNTSITAIKTKTDFLPSATAGASGGVLIAGSNATTTFANLAVTSNITVGGGLSIAGTVAFGSTLTVIGTVNFNDAINIQGNLHVVSNFNVDGAATFTGGLTSNITGNLSGSVGSVTAGVAVSGTVALTDGSLTTASFAAGTTIPRVTIADTVTTVTGLTVANLDATVSSRAPLATALSTATWTGALATGLGVTNAQVLLIPRASGGTFIHTNVNTAETASVAITQ